MTVTIDLTDSSSTRSEQISSHHLIFHFLSFFPSLPFAHFALCFIDQFVCREREKSRKNSGQPLTACDDSISSWLDITTDPFGLSAKIEEEKRVRQSFVSWYSPSWNKSMIWTQEHFGLQVSHLQVTLYIRAFVDPKESEARFYRFLENVLLIIVIISIASFYIRDIIHSNVTSFTQVCMCVLHWSQTSRHVLSFFN